MSLHRKQRVLLHNLLEGELPHNLAWRDLVDLIEKLGRVEPHGGEEVAFVVGSQRALFKRTSAHSVDPEEVSRVRRFLHEARVEVPREAGNHPGRVVVIIDHRSARVYEANGDTRTGEEASVRPYDPHEFRRHLIHRREAHYQGERVPEETSFYEDVMEKLVTAREIVLVGHGTGTSSALEVFVEYLEAHRKDIYARVVEKEVIDLSALSDGEIEAIGAGRL